MNPRPRLLGLASLLALGACSDSSGGTPPLPTGAHAVPLEALDWSAAGGWIVVRVPERTEDLNRDGDTSDTVLVVVEAETGSRTTIPVAANDFVLAPPWLAFRTFEAHHGARDLNADGDVNDLVLFVHDLRTRATRNLRLAVPVSPLPDLALEGDVLAFNVSEAFQGTDLDGDGAVAGNVVHVLDLARGGPHSLGIRSTPTSTLLVSAGRVLFTAQEAGGSDLNGDGDTDDQVLHVHDTVLGTTRNLRRAIQHFSLQAAGDLMTCRVSEAAQGGLDLNGDGNAVGFLLEIHDLGAGTSTLVTTPHTAEVLSAELVFFGTFENAADLNGDGDTLDMIAAYYDRLSGILATTDVALPGFFQPGTSTPVVAGRTAVFPVDEQSQGFTDLDGDGDVLDRVVHALDGSTGLVVSTGEPLNDGFRLLGFSAPYVVVGSPDPLEPALGVVRVHDLSTGLSTPLGVTTQRLSVQDGIALAWELRRADDGSPAGVFLVAFDLATGARFDTDVEMAGTTGDPEPVVQGDLVALLARELGRDLNGDGDTFDQVPMIVRLPFGRR